MTWIRQSSRSHCGVLASLLLGAWAGGASALDRLPAGAVLVAEAAPGAAAAALAGRFVLLLAQRRDAELAGELLAAATSAPPVVYEPAAAALLERLLRSAPRPALQPALQILAARPARVLQRHPETAADWFEPAYDVAGRAGAVLRSWQVARHALALQHGWRRAPAGALRDLAKSGDAARQQAVIAAIEGLDAATFAAIASRLDQVDVARLPSGVAAALALRSPHPQTWIAALAGAAPADALRLLTQAPARLGSSAIGVVDAALARPELGSAGVLALGTLAARDPALRARLHAWLGDAGLGASAAVAMARWRDPRVGTALLARLDREPAPILQRHVALYARLSDDLKLQSGLQERALRGALDPELARELLP